MSQLKVVIVDDEPSYLKALERTVKIMPDCEIVGIGTNGMEGLQFVRDHQPQIVLTDINMPKMTGIELTASIAAEVPDCHVVILTVNEDDESIYEAFRAGAMGYLLKTSTPSDVMDAIRSAVKGEARITPKVAARLISDFRQGQKPQKSADAEILQLSSREQEILALIGQGLRNKHISEQLKISEKTVKNHVSAILKALRVSSRTEAAMRAVNHGANA